MLALSRKKDEAIIINDDIEITIIEIKGDQVKLGISAPKSVPIYRKEVYAQILDSNKEAASSVDVKSLNQLFNKCFVLFVYIFAQRVKFYLTFSDICSTT